MCGAPNTDRRHSNCEFSLVFTLQINFGFSNMDDFSRDFNCPVGSNMTPPKENKCQVNFHVFSPYVQNFAGVMTR